MSLTFIIAETFESIGLEEQHGRLRERQSLWGPGWPYHDQRDPRQDSRLCEKTCRPPQSLSTSEPGNTSGHPSPSSFRSPNRSLKQTGRTLTLSLPSWIRQAKYKVSLIKCIEMNTAVQMCSKQACLFICKKDYWVMCGMCVFRCVDPCVEVYVHVSACACGCPSCMSGSGVVLSCSGPYLLRQMRSPNLRLSAGWLGWSASPRNCPVSASLALGF